MQGASKTPPQDMTQTDKVVLADNFASTKEKETQILLFLIGDIPLNCIKAKVVCIYCHKNTTLAFQNLFLFFFGWRLLFTIVNLNLLLGSKIENGKKESKKKKNKEKKK